MPLTLILIYHAKREITINSILTYLALEKHMSGRCVMTVACTVVVVLRAEMRRNPMGCVGFERKKPTLSHKQQQHKHIRFNELISRRFVSAHPLAMGVASFRLCI